MTASGNAGTGSNHTLELPAIGNKLARVRGLNDE